MLDKKVKQSLTDKHILCFGNSPSFFIQNPLRVEWFGAYSSLHGSSRLTSAINVYQVASVSQNQERVLRIISPHYPAINLSFDKTAFDADKGTTLDLIDQMIKSLKKQQINPYQGINIFIDSDHKHSFHFGTSSGFLLLILEAILISSKGKPSLTIEEKLSIIHSIEQLQLHRPIHFHDALPMLTGGSTFFEIDKQQIPIYQRKMGTFKQYKIVTLSFHNFIYQPHLSIKNIVEQMNIIAQHYLQKRLIDVDPLTFQHDARQLGLLYGTKAIAKANHFFQENLATKQSFLALEKEDELGFSHLLVQAQKRDFDWLEHHLVSSPSELKISNTIKWLKTHFPKISFRLHGFGFQADFLLLIPVDGYREIFARLKKQFYQDQLKEIRIVNQGIRVFNI